MATILVLDHDEKVRNFVKTALRSEGHTVYAFDDARTVLDVVSFDGIDLVIADLNLPCSGEAVIRTLRNRGVQLPIIATTPYLPEPREGTIRALGAQAVLAKPFDLGNFLKVVSCQLEYDAARKKAWGAQAARLSRPVRDIKVLRVNYAASPSRMPRR